MAIRAARQVRRTNTATPSTTAIAAPIARATVAVAGPAPARRSINIAPSRPGPSAMMPLMIQNGQHSDREGFHQVKAGEPPVLDGRRADCQRVVEALWRDAGHCDPIRRSPSYPLGK